MSIRRSKKTDQLDQRSTHQGFYFPFRQRRVHTRAVSARSESQCGRTRCPRRLYRRFRRRGRPSPQRQRQRQLSVNRSRRIYARCDWFSSVTYDLLSCRAGTAAFLCFCIAQLEQQARSCPICRTDISMVLRLY